MLGLAKKLSTKTKWCWRLGFTAVLLILIYWIQEPLLIGIAETWIVRDSVEHADAIVLLGGGLQTRPFEVARLYREGYAPKVLVTNIERGPEDDGAVSLTTQHEIRVLALLGVPESAMVVIGKDVSSTFEEAEAAKKWVQQTGAKRLILPTEFFHTRRVRWIFRKVLKGANVDSRVHAFDPQKYSVTDWWKDEDGLITFQNEVVKFSLYLVEY